jgi:cytochrome c oxidase assembly factor CtaG
MPVAVALDTRWTLDAAPLALAAVAAALYAQAYLRLRRRTGAAHARPARAALFAAGLLLSLSALVSPIDAIGEEQLLSAHMLQHLLLGDLGALLIVLGLVGPLAVFFLPPPLLRLVGRGAPRRVLSVLLRPQVALMLWLVSLAAWHVPAAYDAAVAHPALHATEHVCFAVAGLLAWTQVIDPARRGRLSVGQRALFAFAMLVASAILAETLLTLDPLYPHYADLAGRPFGWSAGQDQSRAALLMMVEQVVTLATAMLVLVRAHLDRVALQAPGYRGGHSRDRTRRVS